MDGLGGDFAYLVESARRTIAQYEVELARQGGVDEARRGKVLRLKIQAELAHFEETLQRSVYNFTMDSEHVKLVEVENVRGTNLSLLRLESAITWARLAEHPDQELAPLYFAEEAGAALIRRPCEVVVIPGADGIYGTPIGVVPWVDPSEGPTEPIVVFIPPSETESSLLFPLLIHEIAHTAVARHELLVKVKKRFSEDWQTTVNEAAGLIEATVEGEDNVARRDAALFKSEFRLEQWANELLCDALATLYCGPPYLYAFAAWVLRRELSGTGESHPPAADRVLSMLTLLERRMGWTEVDRLGPMGEWLRFVSNAKLPVGDVSDFDRRLLQTMQPLAQCVHEIAQEHVGDTAFRPEDARQLEQISMLLKLGILPAQLEDDTAADPRTILLAGWHHILGLSTDSPPGPGQLPVALGDVPLQKLLSRGIELSYVVGAWGSSRMVGG